MSVNLAEVIQTKHVITFGLVVLGTNGARVIYCLAMVKHQAVDYFGGGSAFGGKGMENFYGSLGVSSDSPASRFLKQRQHRRRRFGAAANCFGDWLYPMPDRAYL